MTAITFLPLEPHPAKPSTLAEIRPGDQLRARGDRAQNLIERL